MELMNQDIIEHTKALTQTDAKDLDIIRLLQEMESLAFGVLANWSNKTDDTKRTYLRCLKMNSKGRGFLPFLVEHWGNEWTLEAYKLDLEKQIKTGAISAGTGRLYFSVALTYIKRLQKRYKLFLNIETYVEGFSGSKGAKKTGLNMDEANKIKEYITETNKPRLMALFCLLAYKGLRQIEIVRLRIKDVDTTNNTINVLGKGRDDYELTNITETTSEALQAYIDTLNTKDGFLFPSNRKPEKAITRSRLRKLFTHPEYGILPKLGIKEKGLHDFRRFSATQAAIVFKGDITKIMQHTRHKSTEMPLVYINLVQGKEDIKELEQHFK